MEIRKMCQGLQISDLFNCHFEPHFMRRGNLTHISNILDYFGHHTSRE